MKTSRKRRLLSQCLIIGLLLSVLPSSEAAAQTPVKEKVGFTQDNDSYDVLDDKEQYELESEVIPVTGEAEEAWFYYGLAAICLVILIVIRIKNSDKTETDYQ